MEHKKVEDLNGYHKNPRKITEKMFTLLGETIQKYGDLSGIVLEVNSGEVIGGNQRTSFFKQNAGDCKIEITKRFEKPTAQGTVAYGHVLYKGEQYSYREVSWDSKTAEEANIIANKVGGFWDNDILANQFDLETLKIGGFEDFELGFANEEVTVDTDDLTKRMDAYLDGNIRQIVLYFGKEQFDVVVPQLDALMEEFGVESHTDVVLKLIEKHNEGN